MGNVLCFEIPGFEVKEEEKPMKVENKLKVVDEDKYKNIKKNKEIDVNEYSVVESFVHSFVHP